MPDGLIAACYAGNLLDLGDPEVFAEPVFGLAAQHQDAFRDLIGLFGSIVVQVFELAVQDEEPVPFDIPVETPQIGVKYLKVGQQRMQRRYYALYFLLVQVQIIQCFHNRFYFNSLHII